jgi:Asp-tRNA(Asn)/Glu-tRNA(Gln) amidotransferase B subunit
MESGSLRVDANISVKVSDGDGEEVGDQENELLRP